MQLFPPLFGSTRRAGNPRATFCESRRWVRVTTAGDPVPLEKGRRAPRWRPTLRLHGSEVGGGREPFPTPIKADNVTCYIIRRLLLSGLFTDPPESVKRSHCCPPANLPAGCLYEDKETKHEYQSAVKRLV